MARLTSPSDLQRLRLPPLPISTEFRLSRRARRLRLELRPGTLRIVVPEGCAAMAVERFLMANLGWIETRVARMGSPVPAEARLLSAPLEVGHSGVVIFRGEEVPLEVRLAEGGRLRVEHRPLLGLGLEIPARWPAEVRIPRARLGLRRWVDAILFGEASEIVAALGHPQGLIPRAIRFGEPRTRWGSCSRAGVIRLNRQLVSAPPEIFRHVVLHELAHLRHMDHSPRFWGLLRELDPQTEAHRRWLRDRGMAPA
jgi:predicted metal-dependent hydrolase